MMAINGNQLPYPNLSDISFSNSEPLTYAYFNAHVVRMLENIRSLNRTATLQKASPTQWGVVRIATVDDIISEDGDRTAVLTNDVMNRAISTMRADNLNGYRLDGKLPMSKNYEWVHGEFTVGLNEHVARRISDSPERVMYVNLYFVPLGKENGIYTARSSKVDSTALSGVVPTDGVINFSDAPKTDGQRRMELYYHRSGYVICRNEPLDDGQRQIRVVYNMLKRK